MNIRAVATAALSVATAACSVLLIGGALRWSQAVVAGLCAAAILPQLRSRRAFERVPPLIAALGVAAIATAIQLVPLPRGLLGLLQPTGADLRDDGADLMGTSPWPCLSLDPPATLRALAMFVILIGVAWVALRFAVSERGRYAILATVAGIGGLTALIVAVHAAVGATSLYGLYAPEQAHPKLLGPLLNDNHLGSLMAICAPIALGLAAYPRQRSTLRAGWLVIVGACGATAVSGNSRGATLALLAGLVLAVGMLVAQRLFPGEGPRRGRDRALTRSLPMLIVAACAIVVIIYASAGNVSSQLSRTTMDEIHHPNSKFAIWRSAEVLVSEAPVFGIGRGAFEVAISRIHPAAAVATFSHAENEYVQTLVDWGLAGTIAIGIALAWVAVTALRRWRAGPLMAGALAALAVIALQSIVDFGLEMLGIAVPVTMILAAVTYVPLREREPSAKTFAPRLALIAALVTAAALLTASVTTTTGEDHDRLARPDVTLADARAAVQRHPLDYFGFAIATQLMMRDDQAGAVRVLNHALRLHPWHAGLHHLAARLLLRAGKLDQAAVEYSAALRGSALPKPILAEALATLGRDHAALAVPTDLPDLDPMIRLLGELKATDVETAWLLRVLDQRPANTQACHALYATAVRANNVASAMTAAARCSALVTKDQRVALAGLLLTSGHFDDAARAMADVESWHDDPVSQVDGWLVLCDATAGQRRWDDAKRCLRKLDVSLLPAARRAEVTSRIDKIDQARQAEITAPAPAPP